MSENHFNSVFTPSYWVAAAREFRNLRSLVLAGLTVAIGVALGAFYIPLDVNLRITPAFLAYVFGAAMFGPVVGLAAGFAYDMTGFLLFPSGVFFPGYTLSAMLEFFIYGLFLYRRRITVWRIFICKIIVDFGVHVCLGALWSVILYGKGYYYYFVKSLLKNAIMLPIEVAALAALFQILIPILRRGGFLPEQRGNRLPFC